MIYHGNTAVLSSGWTAVILWYSLDHDFNLSIYDVASSTEILRIMMGFIAIGAPLAAACTFFVYRTF